MKSIELQPNKENLLRTFELDAIERNVDIYRFINLLNAIEDNCSVALDGAWGSGKTFFVKQTKMILDAYNEFIGSHDDIENNTIRTHFEAMQTGMRRVPIDVQPEVSVYYDAWSNDNDIDPMLSLVYEILQTVNTDYSFKKSADCLKIAAAIADFFTGKKVTTLVEAFTQTDRLAALKEQKSIHTLISEFLDSLLAEQGNRLVIFIDELDRCKPSYAVQLLERIKHYFSNERVTFVFSINTNELQHKPPADITEKVANPTKARTEKSNPSAPFSNSKERSDAESFEPERTRPYVRQQIQEIKAERQTEKQKQPARDKTRQTTHKQPQKNKYREKGR